MPLLQEERQEMGYSRPSAGINPSHGPRGNMTPLRRIQRTKEEGEEVIPIYPISTFSEKGDQLQNVTLFFFLIFGAVFFFDL